MSTFFKNIDVSDVEAIRNSFGEKYIFLETISIETTSPILKRTAQETMNLLSSDYCTLLKIDAITDLRELVAYTDSTFDLMAKVQDPEFALNLFGLHDESSPEELTSRYEKIKSELEQVLEGFDLESTKAPVLNEIASLDLAFQKGMKLLVHDSLNRITEIPATNTAMKRWKLIALFGLVVVIIIVTLIYFKK